VAGDGYANIKKEPQNPSRFFNITTKLPLELQMSISSFVSGYSKEIIPASAIKLYSSFLLKEMK